MTLTGLQRAKLLHLFEVYDASGNGCLERDDYELVAHAVATERGYAIGSAEHEAITRTFLTQFARIAAIADFSRDGRIEPDEWLDFFEIVLGDERAFDSVVGATLDMIFEMFDLDDDAILDRGELARLRRALRLEAGDSDAIFDALDRDGDGTLCAAEIRAAIEQFFESDEPEAPGNGFFGPLGV